MSTSPSALTIEQRLTNERLSRSCRFIGVAGVAWLVFCFDYAFSGAAMCSLVCLVGASGALAVYRYSLGSRPPDKALAAQSYTAVSFVLLILVSLLTGQSQSSATLFILCIGVFAYHMLSLRAALFWSVLSAVALFFIHTGFVFGEFPVLTQHTAWERTTHSIGVVALLFFFNYNAQHYFRVQASNLIQLRESLAEKATALDKLAQFDPLTGLFNRHSFHRQVRISMASSTSSGSLGLLLLDLDGFNVINDTLGHQAGDAILLAVSERLREFVCAEHLVARLGGDEFTVIHENVSGAEEVHEFATALARKISEPYFLNGREYSIGVSIGASLYPNHADSMETLLAFADTAMYKAKDNDEPVVVYQPNMTLELVQRRNLENQLSTALPNDEFEVFYQPQVDVRTGKILGAEALLRWRKGDIWVSPAEFISALESSKEIREVGRWVLKQACEQARDWCDCGYRLTVSVNVSSVQFQDSHVVSAVLESLESSGLDPALLDLEITESMLIHDVELTRSMLFELRDMGVSISIDDFGTGYSSMSYLRDLPITRLKIDRAFIKDIPDADDGTIAQTMINLAHNLKLSVLAEGVETQEQLDFLGSRECDAFQGFLCSKPINADDFKSLLELHQPIHTQHSHGHAAEPVSGL